MALLGSCGGPARARDGHDDGTDRRRTAAIAQPTAPRVGRDAELFDYDAVRAEIRLHIPGQAATRATRSADLGDHQRVPLRVTEPEQRRDGTAHAGDLLVNVD